MKIARDAIATIVIGSSPASDELRRHLGPRGVRPGLEASGAPAHPERELVIVCAALDETTIERHGSALAHLLADRGRHSGTVRSVAVLGETGLTRQAAELGFDVYVNDSAAAAQAIRLIQRDWRHRTVSRATARRRPAMTRRRGTGSPWRGDVADELFVHRTSD